MWIVKKIKEIFLILEHKRIMREINKNPEIKDVEVPDEVHDAIFAEIRRKEDEWERERQALELLSKENKELIRLGKAYKRSLHCRKYVILASILVLTLAAGITSFGSVDRMFHKITSMIGGRTRETVDTDGVKVLEDNEEAVYAEIENMYGFYPVRMTYLPEGVKLLEANIMQGVSKISLTYGIDQKAYIMYDIFCGYQDGSWSKDIEDQFIDKYVVNQSGIEIEVKEFLVDNMESRWLIQFTYENSYYKINLLDVNQKEVSKIIEHLFLP